MPRRFVRRVECDRGRKPVLKSRCGRRSFPWGCRIAVSFLPCSYFDSAVLLPGDAR